MHDPADLHGPTLDPDAGARAKQAAKCHARQRRDSDSGTHWRRRNSEPASAVSNCGRRNPMLPLILQAGTGEARLDIISLILGASPVVKGVLGLLILMSIASWFVIGSKAIYLSNATSRSAKFQDAFWKTGRLDEIWRVTEASAPSPVSEVFRAGYTELAKLQKRRQEAPDSAGDELLGDIESVQRALDRARTTAITDMESRVPLLGTTASAGPF